MNSNQILDYVCQILNIKTDNDLVVMDMIEDLKEIQDLQSFRLFIKECKDYEAYKFERGYPKFVSMARDFKKAHKPTLDSKTLEKVQTFAKKLLDKTTTIYDEINWKLQADRKKITNVENINTFFDEKENQVLNMIGTPKRIMNLVLHGKENLRKEIESKIELLAYKKQYPQLEKPNEVMKLIKGSK